MEAKRIGRPSKGARIMLRSRVPVALAEAARSHAAERGMTVTDLVGVLLAAETGVPYQSQEGLPLTTPS